MTPPVKIAAGIHRRLAVNEMRAPEVHIRLRRTDRRRASEDDLRVAWGILMSVALGLIGWSLIFLVAALIGR
jgi:hypothetical protein